MWSLRQQGDAALSVGKCGMKQRRVSTYGIERGALLVFILVEFFELKRKGEIDVALSVGKCGMEQWTGMELRKEREGGIFCCFVPGKG